MRTGTPYEFSVMEEIHNTLTDPRMVSRKTYNKVATTLLLAKDVQGIKRYVSTCDICQKAKPRRHAPAGLLQLFYSSPAF